MKKEEILKKLKELPYPQEEYWLITGAAMVLSLGLIGIKGLNLGIEFQGQNNFV